ncbi:MAG: metalloprotease TldD, partial [Proteobacteria bacterium]
MIESQVKLDLLYANNLDEKFLDQQASKLSLRGVDFADLYLQSSTTESWVLDEGIIKSGSYAV